MKMCPDCLQPNEDRALCCPCGYEFAPEGQSQELARNGASWFYWIAGLTAVNSVLSLLGIQIEFLIGLGIVQFVRAMVGGFLGVEMPNLAFDPRLLPSLGLELLLVLSVVAVGWAASRGLAAAFVTGSLIYALDTVFFALSGEMASFILHLVALFFLIKGYFATRKANRSSAASLEAAPAPSRPRLYLAAGLAPVLFAPFLLIAALGLFFHVNQLAYQQVFARAPESFSAEDRQRLQVAFDAVDFKLRNGGLEPADAQRMNAAMMRIVDRPLDSPATREEMLELTHLVEIAAGSGIGAAQAHPPGVPPR